jgi:hypothetical protein
LPVATDGERERVLETFEVEEVRRDAATPVVAVRDRPTRIDEVAVLHDPDVQRGVALELVEPEHVLEVDGAADGVVTRALHAEHVLDQRPIFDVVDELGVGVIVHALR